MAGIFFQVKDFEAKKRALTAESEAYRQMLRLQLQNLSLHAASLRQRVRTVTTNPLLRLLPFFGTVFGSPFGSPLQGFLFRGKKSKRLRWLGMAYVAWKTYGNLKPLLRSFRRKPGPRADSEPELPEARSAA
jgi:hypothetical protein